MLKGVTFTLAGLLAVFALAAGQANAAPAVRYDQAAAAGALIIWSEPGFFGSFAVIREVDIPTTQCSVVPPLGMAGSVINAVAGTRIRQVEFHTTSACNDAQPMVLTAGDPPAVYPAFPAKTFYVGVPV